MYIWKFSTPLKFAASVIWNICEFIGVSAPCPSKIFNLIVDGGIEIGGPGFDEKVKAWEKKYKYILDNVPLRPTENGYIVNERYIIYKGHEYFYDKLVNVGDRSKSYKLKKLLDHVK
jgi:hypothetical protein